MSEFAKYEQAFNPADRHKSAKTLAAMAREDGLDQISTIRMLRTVCSLSMHDAKEVMFDDLDAVQEKLANELRSAFRLVGWPDSTKVVMRFKCVLSDEDRAELTKFAERLKGKINIEVYPDPDFGWHE